MIKRLDHTQPAIAASIYDVFQVSYTVEAGLLGITDFAPLKRSAIDLQNSNTKFFGFWEDDTLAGVVELKRAGTTIDICSLIVDPVFFRQGIANKLLRFVEHFDDSKTMVVETGLANEPAISLYKKYGFEEQKIWVTSQGIRKISLSKTKQSY